MNEEQVQSPHIFHQKKKKAAIRRGLAKPPFFAYADPETGFRDRSCGA